MDYAKSMTRLGLAGDGIGIGIGIGIRHHAKNLATFVVVPTDLPDGRIGGSSRGGVAVDQLLEKINGAVGLGLRTSIDSHHCAVTVRN